MRPAHAWTIGGRRVLVFDDAIPADEFDRVATRFDRAPFVRDEADGPDTAHIRTFSAEVNLDEYLLSATHRAIDALVHREFPDRTLDLHRAHCNLTVFGDAGFPHRDCAVTRDDVTALLFVNREWPREWGGELTFFDPTGDPTHVILPRPRRVAVFEGAIEHRVGVPLRTCHAARLTLACKYKTPGEQW